MTSAWLPKQYKIVAKMDTTVIILLHVESRGQLSTFLVCTYTKLPANQWNDTYYTSGYQGNTNGCYDTDDDIHGGDY